MSAAVFPWQTAQWRRVCKLEHGDRLPHALLLSGARGMGKRHFARTLMHWLLCDRRAELTAACGECRGCGLAGGKSHPDLSRLDPEEGKTTIKVEAVRELIAYLQLTPSHNTRKLVLVEQGDGLAAGAANTLLKVLEEPPGTALFVLVADRPAALPVTIRSRCQRLAFPAPATGVALAWLAEQGVGAEAEQLLGFSNGAPLRALEFAQSKTLPVLVGVAADVQRLLSGGEDPVRVARKWSKLPLAETVAVVSSAVAAQARAKLLQDTDDGRHSGTQALDSRRLFEAFDECTRVRALVERRTLSANEQVMAGQRLALACSLAGVRS